MRSFIHFVISLVIASALTVVSAVVATWLGWDGVINELELAVVFLNFSCTYLCVMESRWNYPVGLLAVIGQVFLFYQGGLFGSVLLSAYLIPALFYGWWRWGPDTDTRPVRHVELRMIPVYALAVGLTYGATVYASSFFPDVKLAYADMAILVGSIFAQFLLDNKRIETWAIWAAVNVLAIWHYHNAGYDFVAAQFIFFLANAGWGWWQWHRSMVRSEPLNYWEE